MSVAWSMVRSFLAVRAPGVYVPFGKSQMPHPRDEGARISAGLPVPYAGSYPIANYRFPPDHRCRGLHVREYPRYWVAHLDRVHPAYDLAEHLRVDAPGAFIAGGAGIGAAIGAALGQDVGSAVIGAGVGALVAAALANVKP